MKLRYRAVSPSDIPACLDLCPARSGEAVFGRAAAEAVWRKLLRSPAFGCEAIEDASGEIIAFASGVFVSKQFIDDEIAAPRPGLNDRILAGFVNGGFPVLSQKEIAQANSTHGLSQAVFYSHWNRSQFNWAEAQEIRHMFMQKHVEMHVGYRMREMAFESRDEIDHLSVEVSEMFKDRYPIEPPYGYLAVATVETVLSLEAHRASPEFRYREPVVFFQPAEQRLLTAALDGATDEELSTTLGVSPAAVKKTWASVFERTRECLPGLLPTDPVDKSTRGLQKRHLLLAWLRENRQELKPLVYPPRSERRRARGAGA